MARSRSRRPIFSYSSAAALWRFPRIGPWPADVHITDAPESGGHSRYGVRYHRERLCESDITVSNGFLVTTPARTIIDLARRASFREAVVAADAALNERRTPERGRVLKTELVEQAQSSLRGASRAGSVVSFADGRSANPGETLSRLVMLETGLIAPELQTEHPNPDGGKYFTDFEWPAYKIIGEFDGRGKYLKDEFLGGRAPGEVVYEEKRREDHLRAEGNTVARWGWRELHEPGRLLAMLSAAGVPYRSSRRAPGSAKPAGPLLLR
ncbi:hypothetical protein [Subtercola endophyticus]|uniref:hypothetical protein n=1 Tax=Subtercola endophyticus TaxID=2895559 RepID=UPI001E2DE5EF|nr:hypothetical protein [Subtercola endophyticus]UFS59305.1 hypothetical protein LQ955_00435 [Subtercola endophyticus]